MIKIADFLYMSDDNLINFIIRIHKTGETYCTGRIQYGVIFLNEEHKYDILKKHVQTWHIDGNGTLVIDADADC